MRIASLYRYPVKGLSPERLDTVQVAAGQGFPLDRAYALLRTGVAFDPAAPAWLAKANFLMLMMHEPLARLRTRFSEADGALQMRTPDGQTLSFRLEEAAGRNALEQFFAGYLGPRVGGAPKLLHAPGHQFTDKAEKYVSLINLASVRALEKSWGQALDPLRFRANIYIDGADPFLELDWVGREVRLGGAYAEVAQRNGRCAATNVNPETGERDRDVPGRLRADFGHKDLGVYLKIVEGGTLQAGDDVEVEPVVRERKLMALRDAPVHPGQLICSACYYLFDPRSLDPAWSGPSHLPADYRCPDCGAGRDAAVAAVSFKPKA